MSSKELLFETFSYEYEHIGKLRFRCYRDLLGGEAAEMEAMQRQMTQATLQMMTLAKRISDGQGIEFEKALEAIASGNIKDASWIGEYAEETFMLISSLPNQSRVDDEMITLFINSRAEIEGENGWEGFEDWTVDDTRRLPRKFRARIRQFIDQEQNGEPAAAEKPAKAGKAQPAS